MIPFKAFIVLYYLFPLRVLT